jgi:transposase
MSTPELERVEVMGRVGNGGLKLTDAAAMLQLSYRQVKRLWRRYQQVGSKGLQHGNAGRASNRSKPAKFRRRVLSLIKQKYSGSEEERFGPTLAAEHLGEEDGIAIDHETLRCWMLAEGLWSRQRKRKKHCQRRERKAHFGELVQLDGSFHDWLEERGPRGCLMDMVDDATSRTQARLGKEETIWAAAGVLRAWIEKYGMPRALYTDWKNVYKRKATPAEKLRGEVPVTQFGRMCQKLGIGIIAASSPQAKGRVERIHGVHQDRLIKKLRRKGIDSYEAANRIWKNSICRSTTVVTRGRRQSRRIITGGSRRPANSIRFSGWRPSAPSATTGWSATTVASCNCRLGSGAMVLPKARR